ncbi:hypothetical protein HC028_19475 [Planosporangium flavigriseum]|uniref:Uncharacterized protein n=1 Tax=Planosporangium flavigriseum TaxID=373681 RepID=A0A8J3PME3_9ACTN|nr:hypothetical protein [Planosporangium flavigriseum]NJC66670.1 hypothetical protein [Planosporangium flavigriseum]GIG74822.1 hypothetical protein Pfl04_32260 [Planosporangium flavigriseum]
MANEDELEELFVRQVDVGVADMDVSTDQGVVTTTVVVERATATERESGEDRQLLLIYGAKEVPALADALRAASERAMVRPR